MKPTQRILREKLANGEKAYGVAVQLPSPEIVEIIGYTGYDFAWIDGEHGSFGLSEIRELIRAADAARIDTIVRVPNHDVTLVQRILDLGAGGIVVPHVRTVEDGTAMVRAAKYGPVGTRGACPGIRSVGHVTEDWVTDYARANADVLVFGLIEDAEGVENVEAIASECGFDGLLFGPFDLAWSIGLHGDINHPDIKAMQQRVLAAVRTAGIEYFSANTEWESDLAGTGASIVAVLGDRFALFHSLRNALAAERASAEQAAARA